MCNISSLYINRGIEKGKINMIIEMYKNNIPIQTIANVAHLSVEETEKIINDNT